MKMYGEWKYSCTYLTCALEGVSGQLHTLAALPLEERAPGAPVDRVSGPHSQSGCCGEEENLLPCQELNSDFLAGQLLASLLY
jgi:hypothetical protein